jgi:hypothetical protein
MEAGLREALSLAGGTHSFEDMLRQIQDGSAQVWCDEGACLVTEVIASPQKRVLHFWLATGELEPVVALSRRVIAWGKEQGCTMATLSGRRGWTRVLTTEGWSPATVVMTREV